MKRNYFLLLDSETTDDNLVADFGAVICDKKGKVMTQCAVLIDGIFNDAVSHPLFSHPDMGDLWSKESLKTRYSNYKNMVESGSRMIASVNAVNNWLAKAAMTYQPILTAYNLSFDRGKCLNTGIDLSLFYRNFCLWHSAVDTFAKTKKYRQMCLDTHAFNEPTAKGNMSFKTNAETMARFCLGNAGLQDEPHTALEDVIFYELPILQKVLAKRTVKSLLTETNGFNWQAVQVRDWFKPS